MTLLRDVIDIPEEVHAGDFVLSLTYGVEHLDETVREYVVTPALAHAFDRALGLVERAVISGRSNAAFLHGSFGSGKSHFMAVLHAILGGNAAARGIPELAAPIARHDASLQGRNFLRLAYHLIGARSLEEALFSGYLSQIRRLHPDAQLPPLQPSDGLLDDADGWRRRLGDEAFFRDLSGGAGGGVWSGLAGGWTAERYDRARRATPEDPERRQLVDAVVRTYYPSFELTAPFVDIDTGLRVLADHAATLGYSAVVLFLDELVLWLATHIADPKWIATEGAKVAKLVESADSRRSIPLVSFIARQRDLRDFLGDAASGAEYAAIADTFRWWEDRFDRITLGDDNLPYVAAKRLLRPKSDDGKRMLDEAFARLDRRPDIWTTLLDGLNVDAQHRGASEKEFRLTYPFSPALVSVLRALSSLMQRERTALKVMQQILVDQRDELQVDDLVPAGDTFDYVVTGSQALDAAMERHFAAARRLHQERFRPMLQRDYELSDEEVRHQARLSPYAVDDRLAKTLLLSGLVPAVPALHDLDAGRLAALNHGTIRSPLPGMESTTVLAKLRQWQPQVPEIQLIGEARNPTVAIHLADVNYQSVLDRVRQEDSTGNRRRLLRELVWESLGITYDRNLFGLKAHAVVWRGSPREVDLAYGNVSDPTDITDQVLWHDDDRWRVVVDYPFDEDPAHTPVDDLARIDDLRERAGPSQTIVWLPRFLSADRLHDLGLLVQLNYLFEGDGSRFDANSDHLPATDKQQARAILRTMQQSLRERLLAVLQQAYGARAVEAGDVEVSRGHDRILATLDPSLTLREPVGATLKDAFVSLTHQLLEHSYPGHPRFEPSHTALQPRELRTALQYIERARQEPNGRVQVPASPERATLRRVCNPLGIGEMLENIFVVDEGTNFPWRTRFTMMMSREGITGAVSVDRLRAWMDADVMRGLTTPVGNLVISAWAVVTDRSWFRYGAPITPPALEQITADMELREQELPPRGIWEAAGRRASALFGMPGVPYLSARGLGEFDSSLRAKAAGYEAAAFDLERELQSRAELLGLDLSAPAGRFATAAATVRALGEIRQAKPGTDIVRVVAGQQFPAEDHVVGRSLESARTVSQALSSTPWNLLRALGQVDDQRRAAADEVLNRLAEAAGVDEFQQPLVTALTRAASEAAKLLAGPVTPPGPSGERDVDDASDVDELAVELRATIEKDPGRRIHVRWWADK